MLRLVRGHELAAKSLLNSRISALRDSLFTEPTLSIISFLLFSKMEQISIVTQIKNARHIKRRALFEDKSLGAGYGVLEGFGNVEFQDGGGGNFDGFASAGIASSAFSALLGCKDAEAGQSDSVASCDFRGDCSEYSFNVCSCSSFGGACGLGNLGREVCFGDLCGHVFPHVLVLRGTTRLEIKF